MIETYDSAEMNKALHELTNMSSLKNVPYILSIEDHYMNSFPAGNKTIYQIEILMELAESSLHKEISDNGEIKEKKLLRYLKQIAKGLVGAKEKKAAHLDLKPQNILIANKECKIADWGGSVFVRSSTGTTCMKSQSADYTAIYASPEFLKQENEINLYQCDVYSLGIIILRCCGVPVKKLQIISKTKKHNDENIEELIDKYLKKNDKYSKKIYRLVRSMCSYNPKDRKKIEEVLEKLEKND